MLTRIAGAPGFGYKSAPLDWAHAGEIVMVQDDLLADRQRGWNTFTKLTAAGVALVALILLAMLIFLA